MSSLQTSYALVNVTFMTNTTINNFQTSFVISQISSASTTISRRISSTYWTTQSDVTTPVDNVRLTLASRKTTALTQQFDTTFLKVTTVTFGLKQPLPTEMAFVYTPIKVQVVAVGATVGLACLGGAGILIHYITSRKCRKMTPVRFVCFFVNQMCIDFECLHKLAQNLSY